MNKNIIVATVGGREITREDLEVLLGNLNPQMAKQYNNQSGRQELLNELINQELFYLDARDANLSEDADFKAELEKAQANLLKQYALNKLLKHISVSEDELEALYHKNESHFKSPERVKASHILVDSEARAKEILGEIEKGLSFEDAAKEYSSCPSKGKGGDLGYFTRGQMVPEFEAAAFEQEREVIGQPVKTQFGYHLIKVYDKKESGTAPLAEVKDKLTQQILAQKQQDVYYRKVAELKSKYEVKIME